MRSVVQKPDPFVTAEFNSSHSDKFVDHGIFIPKRIDFTSRYFEGLKTTVAAKSFDGLKKELVNNLAQIIKSKSLLGKLKLSLTNFMNDINKCKTLDELLAILKNFYDNKYLNLEDLNPKQFDQLQKFKKISNFYKLAPDMNSIDPGDIVTSELGLLFLDRTRLRPNGFSIGEHVTSVSLGPGDELTLEQKSTFKETRSVENIIEKEFELTLENTRESSFKNDAELQTTTTAGQTDTSTVNANIAGSFESLGLPVDASVGASGSGTTQQSITNASTVSSDLARTISEKISSKLRKNHKTTITETTESTFENTTKRVIKNINKGTPVTYNFFKVMQKLEAQVQRKGIRLCWAPFVRKPGRSILQRMDLAEMIIYKRAKRGLKMPQPPSPPRPELDPVWRLGSPKTYKFNGIPIDPDDADSITISVKLQPKDVFVKAALKVSGDNPWNAGWNTRGTLHNIDEPDTDADFEVIKPRKVGDEYFLTIFLYSNGGDFSSLTFELDVQVIPYNNAYKKELLAYSMQLTAYYDALAAMINQMREDVKDEAHAARQNALEKADIRSELLHAVIKQYIQTTFWDEGVEIELWHRIIDFENIGYKLYPNWWNQKTPVPELPDTSFLNASWARVFLPIRRGYEKYAVALIFGNKGKTFYAANNFAKDFDDAQKLFKNNKKEPLVVDIGNPWIITTPTDGTHIETMLGATNSLDDDSIKDISLLVDRAQAEIDNINTEIGLKNQAQPPFNVNVNLD